MKLSPWPHYEQDEIDAAMTILSTGDVNYWTGTEGKDFEAEFAGQNIEYSDSGHSLDGIIGGQALKSLTDQWYVSFYGDVGTGDNEVTSQVWPVVGYRLENLDVVAGYRHINFETDDGDTFNDLSFSGPLLGIKYWF